MSYKENRIGRYGRPRGEVRILRPIKLYKTSYDLREEQEDDGSVINVPSIEELEENPNLGERTNALIKSLKEEHQLRAKTLSKVTPAERERLLLEELILELKMSIGGSRTISGSLTEIELAGYDPELLTKAQPLDPDFISPLLTALKKRPARREKAQRAIERILLKRGAGEPPQEER